MVKMMVEIAVVIFVFVLGYWMGFRACFDYLMEEVKEHRHE
jgi:Tfp pilus assembly protein PilO